MLGILSRKEIPTNEVKEVEILKAWSVSYPNFFCSYGQYTYSTLFNIEKNKEFFTHKKDAEDFKQSLINAFTLIKSQQFIKLIEMKEES